jgi:hypothetical protein
MSYTSGETSARRGSVNLGTFEGANLTRYRALRRSAERAATLCDIAAFVWALLLIALVLFYPW